MTLSPNVLNNTLEFLRRVEMKGLEAFGFVEAYTALQNDLAVAQNPQLAAAAAAQLALANPATQPPAPSDPSTAGPPPTPKVYAKPKKANP